MRRLLVLASVLGGLAAAPAIAETAHGALSLSSPWSRATAPTARAGAAYLTIHNQGTNADRLVGAAAEIAETVELHTHANNNGVMEMTPVPAVDLPPGATVTLEPGGLHIMLIGLRQPLEQGARFPLTLTFERAGSITLEAEIAGPGARAPGDAAGRHEGDHADHGHQDQGHHNHGHQNQGQQGGATTDEGTRRN